MMLNSKIVISIIAQVSSGKSTLINALVFNNNILENKNGETTAHNFKISYKKNIDITKQKNLVAEYNSSNLTEIKEYQLYTNNPLFKEVIILDTPGFNSTNEEYMQPKIDKALEISDIVILVLDIQKGITKEDIDQIKNIKNKGITKIIVVLNQKDKLDEETNIEPFISKISKTISKYIDFYEPIFIISAKQALAGYVSNNKNKIKQSNILNLQNQLLNIINEKTKILKENEKKKKQYINKIKKIKKDILNTIYSVDNNFNSSSINIIKNDIESFKYYFEYPMTLFGYFDKDSFYEELELYEEEINQYKLFFEELANDINTLSDRCSQLADNSELEEILFDDSIYLSSLNMKLVSLYSKISNIIINLDLIIFLLYQFFLEEKEKDWLECDSKKGLQTLEEIYQKNKNISLEIEKSIKNINSKLKELKDECRTKKHN